MSWQVIQADVMDGLASLPDASVQTVVTSPPYWGLRDYGTAEWEGGDAACDHKHAVAPRRTAVNGVFQDAREGQPARDALNEIPYRERCGKCGAVRRDQQIGLELTPEAYVERMVAVFREVRRVLRPDGTVWLNLGDSYVSNGRYESDRSEYVGDLGKYDHRDPRPGARGMGLKPKDLVGIPWRVAFALQADGWYLRSDIIWAKPNPMPESVTDRPTKAHEYVFLLTKSARYFYDADAVREQSKYGTDLGLLRGRSFVDGERVAAHAPSIQARQEAGVDSRTANVDGARNLRSVWSIPTEPYPEAHFATFPKALVVPCVKAGTSEKGCCPECGAAWVRQVETDYTKHRPSGGKTSRVERGNKVHDGGFGGWGSFGTNLRKQVATTGWRPSCSHYPPYGQDGQEPKGSGFPVVPCTVLDPFAGSGTVGVVALRHGRSFIGIELSLTYAEMARERIRNDAPLFNHDAEVVTA